MRKLLAFIDVACLLIIFRFRIKELKGFVDFVYNAWDDYNAKEENDLSKEEQF